VPDVPLNPKRRRLVLLQTGVWDPGAEGQRKYGWRGRTASM
jgi:hypothetical protein